MDKKTWMLEKGEWRPTNPEAEDPKKVGFHLSALYSPAGWRSWADIVRAFLKAKAHPARLKAWVNGDLGEVWEEEAEAEDPDLLLQRREVYEADPIPEGVVVLTAGVDVQDDRLEMEVIGWGRGGVSWGIEHKVFRGDPAGSVVWRSLELALQKRYQHPRISSTMPIAAACVDSGGHYTTEVYNYCRRRYARRVFAIKGKGGPGRPIVAYPTKAKIKDSKATVRLFTVGVDGVKTQIYSNLKVTDPKIEGYCHFPTRYEEEYFKQLCGEKRVTEISKKTGALVRIWKRIHANEILDIRVYATAALELLSADLDQLADLIDRKAEAEASGGVPKERPAKKRNRKRPRKNFGKDGIQ
jgi:phage terminase large subunit GpA-like protein